MIPISIPKDVIPNINHPYITNTFNGTFKSLNLIIIVQSPYRNYNYQFQFVDSLKIILEKFGLVDYFPFSSFLFNKNSINLERDTSPLYSLITAINFLSKDIVIASFVLIVPISNRQK